MFARVSTYEGDAEPLREGFESVTDSLRQIDGFECAYFLLGDGGKAISISMWESQDALDASAEAANRLREGATQPAGATITSVESYEVAVHHRLEPLALRHPHLRLGACPRHLPVSWTRASAKDADETEGEEIDPRHCSHQREQPISF